MGLASLVKKVKSEKNEGFGSRFFSHLRSRPPKIIQPMNEGDYFRISSLYKLCAREEVLASREGIKRAEYIEPGLQITFDVGHMFHDLYRDCYWGPMGDWLGAWECKRCGWNTDKEGLSHGPIKGERMAKLAQMPDKCPDCGALRLIPCEECGESRIGAVCSGCGHVRDDTVDIMNDNGVITFMEWTVEDHEIMLRGHVDGWRRQPVGRPIISDLKSHSSNGFIRRSGLREGHDLQVWGYQHCSGETRQKGELIYMNKSPWGDHTSFIRDFAIPFDKKSFDAHVRAPLIDLQNGLSGGKLPKRICVNETCPRAKDCQVRSICF